MISSKFYEVMPTYALVVLIDADRSTAGRGTPRFRYESGPLFTMPPTPPKGATILSSGRF
jgi:hypothetical protein